DGTIVSYQWFEGNTPLGTGPTIQTKLTDGAHTITLLVTDNDGNTATSQIVVTVAAPVRTALETVSGLTKTQLSVATTPDRICGRLRTLTTALTPDQADLLNRCDGIQVGNSAQNQVQALDALSGNDFAAARVQSLLFSNFLQAGVTDRLMALRGGAKGLSVA